MDRTMECEHSEQFTALMSLELDGRLDGDDRQRLEQHLVTCPACRVEWQAMQQVSALFAASPMVGPPLGFAVRLERRLAEKKKQRRQLFGGLALLTGSLSLAGVTVAVVVLIVLGVIAWQSFDSSPAMQQGTELASQVASGVGLVGKGASFFLGDLLLRYGAPLVLLLLAGLVLLVALWAWLLVKGPGGTRHNGYV